MLILRLLFITDFPYLLLKWKDWLESAVLPVRATKRLHKLFLKFFLTVLPFVIEVSQLDMKFPKALHFQWITLPLQMSPFKSVYKVIVACLPNVNSCHLPSRPTLYISESNFKLDSPLLFSAFIYWLCSRCLLKDFHSIVKKKKKSIRIVNI